MNGDGVDDLITSDFSLATGGQPTGRGFVLFGGSSLPTETDIPRDDLTINNGVVLTQNTPDTGYRMGECVSIIKDLNGDGIDEIGISNNEGQSVTGDHVYVIFGNANLGNTINMADIDDRFTNDTSKGLTISGGEVCDIASIGDINNDGFNDIAAFDNFNGPGPSEAYIIYGGDTLPSRIDLRYDSDRFVKIDSGYILNVTGAGDVNNDNYDDFLITTNNLQGEVYLVFDGEYFFSPN